MVSQLDKLQKLLSDHKPHSTVEILKKVYGREHFGIARIGARIWDLKKRGLKIKGWKDKKRPTVYWYQEII